MAQDEHCEPAAAIIERLGGVTSVAAVLGISEISVRRRRRAAPSGDGGRFFDEEKIRLLEYAAAHGIDLSWDDFKPQELADTS